jgi:hypothetical protein
VLARERQPHLLRKPRKQPRLGNVLDVGDSHAPWRRRRG